MFSTKAWEEVGYKLWLFTIEGGKEAKEAKALGLTWRAVTGTLAEMKTERTVATVAIEALESSSSGKGTDGGLMERQPETRAESRLARFFGLAARRPIKGTAAPVRSLQELLDSAGQDVIPPMAEREMAANAGAEPPDSGGGAQAGQGDTGSPGARPKAAERPRGPKSQPKAAGCNPPLRDSGAMSGSEAASAVSSPAEPEPARAAGGQPGEAPRNDTRSNQKAC